MKLERFFTIGLISTGVMFTACKDEEEIIDEGNGGGTTEPSSITVDGSTTISIGDIVYQAVDTLLQDSVMMAEGEDMTWNFDWLTEHETDTINFIDPASTPNGADFSASNLAMFEGSAADQYMYATSAGTGVTLDGMSMDVIGDGNWSSLHFSNEMSFINYPASYGDSFSDDFFMDQTVAISVDLGGGMTADSMRLKRTGTVNVNVDGWGSATTPLGTFDVIRMTRVEDAIDSTWIYIESLGGWTSTGDPSVELNTTVQFQANDHAFPVAEFDLDSIGVDAVKGRFLK